MYEMHYTFEDVRTMTLDQLNFLVEGIKRYKEEEARAIKQARGKMRRPRRR